MNYTNINMHRVENTVHNHADSVAQGLASIRSARRRRLDNITTNNVAAHEMSCAIGDLLRILGVPES